ncbi:MAG: thioesterase [Burkholderiaceae bacterium]|nr:thioesterase [Burkholderiaceae bacterium]
MTASTAALRSGLTGTTNIVVTEQHTARHMGSGRMPVLATPALAALMEAAAQQAIDAHLPPGQQTIGTHIDLHHHGATPIGLRVTASAELISIDGRLLTFRIVAHDGNEQIGEAQHLRALTSTATFERLLRKKTNDTTSAANAISTFSAANGSKAQTER